MLLQNNLQIVVNINLIWRLVKTVVLIWCADTFLFSLKKTRCRSFGFYIVKENGQKKSVDSWKSFIYHTSLVWISDTIHPGILAIKFMKKLLSLTLAVMFSLSIFAATGFSKSDCGQVCCCSSKMQGMQLTTRLQAQVNSNCCSQASEQPCGFTKNRNVELPLCTISAGRINTGTSVGAAFVQTTLLAANEFILNRARGPVAKFSIRSAPLYLQHLSLLIWFFPVGAIPPPTNHACHKAMIGVEAVL